MVLSEHLKNVKSTLKKSLQGIARNTATETIDSEIRQLTHSLGSLTLLHDITDSHYARVQVVLNDSLRIHKHQIKRLNNNLKSLNLKIASTERNLERAPDAETLIKEFQEIGKKQVDISKQETKMKMHQRKFETVPEKCN